ncbi:hypothetical protein EIMP300_33630 [Escherichia coli]|uniref:Zinc ribbon domain-containing protein n=16 Tax=Escherichia coli TaxID=562 RepID=A0A8S0FN89_ECOLX|nr:hypothetical protein EIMP300_33630 [Escherichia coli]
MALNCPTCKTPLERNGETAHCATCDKDFTVQALCPECHQPLQVLKACGAVDYFCQHGHGLISKKRVEILVNVQICYCLISLECIVLSFVFNVQMIKQSVMVE